jgi:DNA replication and repair protein RecF
VLQIDYRPTFPLPGDRPSVDAVEETFRAQLRTVQPRDVAAGISVVGPHRDDLAFVVDGHPMGAFGSRGQQRTVALALKLAEAEFLQARTGDPPMLLLDDVLSELDAARRRHVLGTVAPGQQVVLTGTDLASFEPEFLGEATVYSVRAGAIELAEATAQSDAERRPTGEARLPHHGR